MPFNSKILMIMKNKMKRYFPLVLVLLILVTMACQGKASDSIYSKNESMESFLAYNGDFHNDIIVPQVKAWKELAKVMYPRVCDDTETEWAAFQVDSLANVILKNPLLSKGEQLARLYEIENTACYGMAYFSAVIGSYTNPDASQEALSIIQRSFEAMDTLKANHYKDADLLMLYEQSVYFNYCAFLILGTRYEEGEPQFVTNNIEMNEFNFACLSHLFKNMEDKTLATRYSSIINNTSFFMTFCPLTFWLAGSAFQEEYMNEYMEIGGWFDKKAAPVISAIRSGGITILSPISEDEFSSLLKQSSDYRAKIINLFAKGIQQKKVESL